MSSDAPTNGAASRTVHSTVPPQVEYALTALGRPPSTALQELGKWAHAHLDEIEGNRSRYDDGTKRPGVSREPTIRRYQIRVERVARQSSDRSPSRRRRTGKFVWKHDAAHL
jgi:hypothetical protein